MGLSHELISQFAKIVNSDKKQNTETTIYGTIVDSEGNKYVRPDGSDQLIPITETEDDIVKDISTTANTEPGDRVSVLIKNHTATVTGNISSPATNNKEVGAKISEFDIAVGEQIQANKAYFKDMMADKANLGNLVAAIISVAELIAKDADVEKLVADEATITDLIAKKIDTDVVIADEALIEKLKASTIDVLSLIADKATIEDLIANNTNINHLIAESSDLKYANIDFSNIGQAAMEYFYSISGLIENVSIGDATISGKLVGVTITGDMIRGNTIVADKLVIQGKDGLYYKLNTSIYDTVYYKVVYDSDTGEYTTTDEIISAIEGSPVETTYIDGDSTVIENVYTTNGDLVYVGVRSGEEEIYFCKTLVYNNEKVDVEQIPSSGIDGTILTAKSVTAEKVKVTDLVAFDATIGGFNITDNSIYSEVKDSEGNTTRGIYMDTDGQINFGDATNYIKYYKDENGNYKLAISAESILYSLNGKSLSLADFANLTESIAIGKYNGEPCIILGEHDSDFKLLITNTRIVFTAGSSVPAYITNEALNIGKAVVENELQVGADNDEDGTWVWKKRANGNLGLQWKGVIT